MTYRVDVTARASRDLRRIYSAIHAGDSRQAHAWFNSLEAAILSLDEYPARGSATREDERLRQVLYGHKPHVYRLIYAIDEQSQIVRVLHIRHGARKAFAPRTL
jgi:toxin ParE1/3/4